MKLACNGKFQFLAVPLKEGFTMSDYCRRSHRIMKLYWIGKVKKNSSRPILMINRGIRVVQDRDRGELL